MLSLMPYQETGAAFLASRRAALVADEPGLGKTAQAIGACDAVGATSVAVICPASVVDNWRREFARFGRAERRLDVLSYDKAMRRGLPQPPYEALILDEAHYLKSRGAKRTKAVLGTKCDGAGLVAQARHVFLLTGTPAPNNPAETWPWLRALAPELILGPNGKPMGYWAFTDRYCKTVDKGFGPAIVGGKNLAELRDRIAPFVLRRRKAEVLPDLPSLRVDTLPLPAAGPLPEVTAGAAEDWQAIIDALRTG